MQCTALLGIHPRVYKNQIAGGSIYKRCKPSRGLWRRRKHPRGTTLGFSLYGLATDEPPAVCGADADEPALGHQLMHAHARQAQFERSPTGRHKVSERAFEPLECVSLREHHLS